MCIQLVSYTFIFVFGDSRLARFDYHQLQLDLIIIQPYILYNRKYVHTSCLFVNNPRIAPRAFVCWLVVLSKLFHLNLLYNVYVYIQSDIEFGYELRN